MPKPPEAFLDAICSHAHDGIDKHGTFEGIDHTISQILERTQKLVLASYGDKSPDTNPEIHRRLHQVAGVALKALTQLNCEPTRAPTPQRRPPSTTTPS